MPATLHDRARDAVAAAPRGLLMDGAWRDASDGARFDVDDPATGAVIADVADGSVVDAVDALDAAVAGQSAWAKTSPSSRSALLQAAFERLAARADEFALIMALESGKPFSEAKGEVTYGASFLRWFAGEALRPHGRFTPSPDGKSRHLVQRRPVGPSLLITPWNFPLAMLTRKVGAAFAAGCTVVIKPAELTPLTATAFAQLLLDVGVPASVVHVVPTTKAAALSTALLADPRLRKISFTGSTAVGRTLLAQAAAGVVRTSMELGGNAPFIVFDDADVDAAVAGAVIAKFRNAGQACTAANRLYVQRGIADRFTTAFIKAVSALPVGHGLDDGTKVGALITRKAREKIDAVVARAKKGGADVLLGGAPIDGAGSFYAPTILAVDADDDLLKDEIFGPVAPIVVFDDEDDVVAAANDTIHGLAAYVFTQDVRRAMRMTEVIDSGMLGVNTGLVSDAAAPFGGIKQSGLGREGGAEGIEEYQTIRYANVMLE